MANLRSVAAIILGLSFFGFGGYLAYSDYTALSGWIPVQGTVTHSELTRGSMNSNGDYFYKADIDYAYSVNGTRYTGNCCGMESTDRTEIKKLVDSNWAGSSADLLVNPASPVESRLRETVNPVNLFYALILLVGLATAAAGALSWTQG